VANPVKGEVPLEAGGKRYVLVLNTYALASIERRMKMSWPKLIQRAALEGWGVEETLATLQAALYKYHRGMTEEQVGEIVDEVGLEKANEALIEAITLMSPKLGGQVDENPPKTATNGTGTNASPSGSP